MRKQIHLLLFIAVIATGILEAQTTDTTLLSIETQDGNIYFGHLSEEDSSKIILDTQNLGLLTIRRADIKIMEKANPEQFIKGEFWSSELRSSQYFFTSNAYDLSKGDLYYRNIWVLWNQINYGFTNNFSLGLGIIPLFLFASEVTPIFLTPSVTFPIKKDRLNIGAGAILVDCNIKSSV
ncbi:MAG: hypothetical protein KDC53_13470 [Saprospiraceae bacterium]|nr:hypothetical protein [Saprospiraceae bacterium]